MKKDTWKTIIQVVISVLTAALTALGTTEWSGLFISFSNVITCQQDFFRETRKNDSIICEFQFFFIPSQAEISKGNMTSSMLIHPGEMIKDEIAARGITQKELAKQMGVSYTVFNEILNGKRPVTTEYALLLEAALGTNASIWIGLQADYNMQKVKQDKPFMKRLEKIRKIAAVL